MPPTLDSQTILDLKEENTQLINAITALRRQHKEEEERLILILKELKLHLSDLPIWVGTKSLQTYDSDAHALTPTTLKQIVPLKKNDSWRSAFTFPIYEGEWELKIQIIENDIYYVMLGFLKHPLPLNAVQDQDGNYPNGTGGDFFLWSGRLWQGGREFKPEGTNKACVEIGQTAAIRVNMSTRVAKLFVDGEEQPGIFTNLPSPLCLEITTGSTEANEHIEVKWFKRLH
ncbi:hypothetical protein BLNAU_17014 [Blattamonas nauphoetae]|uniref:Uncharacterized protein n=1 Tax=Blattamonas nauphoetae TaxID=2049346 RepID=A0ABQ9X7X8_9EUKA|nr:hypothetical protein BLNAU_17014 [Blattamonas nauphoetae]